MRKALLALSALILLVLLVVAIRTARFAPRPVAIRQAGIASATRPGAADRLAGAVRIPSVSHENPALFDAGPFRDLHGYLSRTFPRVHAQLQREVVGEHSLLYRWPGSDTSLKPMLIAAHMDVVPVEPGTEGRWTHPAFAGVVDSQFIWGRGSIDNKSAVIGVLEAVEALLLEGFAPRDARRRPRVGRRRPRNTWGAGSPLASWRRAYD